MHVLELVRKQYKIDDNRIYLMGHSMGGIGTWKLAPKYPDIWAAIAPFSGSGAPATLENASRTSPSSSSTATTTRRSTSPARARWWRS